MASLRNLPHLGFGRAPNRRLLKVEGCLEDLYVVWKGRHFEAKGGEKLAHGTILGQYLAAKLRCPSRPGIADHLGEEGRTDPQALHVRTNDNGEFGALVG